MEPATLARVVAGMFGVGGHGPRLLVYLTFAPSPDDRAGVDRGYLNLGPLHALAGAQEYPIPAGTDLRTYNGGVVYCVEFHVSFLAAPLTRP